MPSNKFDSQDNVEKVDPEQQGLKQICFQALHCLHRSNQNIHNGFYYILCGIQFLQIFFYITHPFFPYYKNSVIMTNIHQFLKYLTFNQFLANDSNLYKFLLPVCFAFIIVQTFTILSVANEIKQKKLINQVKKIHYVINVMFLVFNTILTVPFFGLSLNVLYCDTTCNRYTLGQECYSGAHIGYCLLAGFVIAALFIQGGINWYIYYNKNPFATDFLAKYDNNAVLGKFFIKIIPIIYVTIDFNLQYVDVFAFGIAGCLCGYIFFFRIFAFHDYNQKNFYFVLFLQVVLAWFSINNIILSYLDTQRKAGGLFQSFLCSLLVAALVLQIQEQNYKKIFMQGMQSQKIKKQNIQKFLYRLIYMFTHSQTDQEKNHLSTIVKILNSKLKESASTDPALNAMKVSKKVEKKFYAFLGKFVGEYLESNWNPMLMTVNCNLLMLEEKFSYAFHQSLELSSKKISVVEELMMYRFRRHQRYDKEKVDTSKKENNNIFMMYYDFNQNLMRLQQQIASCTFNNLDYWQQVAQANPSIYKIRNLAYKYQHYQQQIDHYYDKIYEIFPNNKLAIKTYIEFLMYVGVNINSLSKAHERYQQAEENIKKTKELERDSGNLIEMGENENLAFVSIQTSEMALGIITNCNTEFKKMLGYDKHQLIDKKVNKIMPKSFSEFHDNLIRAHVQKRQHNQKNKVQRIVYALSKSNFLVEVVLFTKVNYKTIGEKPALELIGFLKKIEDPNKAVIILEMNSQNIAGANAGFSTLIDDGISNSEFANNQIKICTLLPNLNTSLVQQGKSQQTNLIFSSSVIVTKSGLNLQVKKKVLIEVEQVKQYSSKQKFAYLVLKQLEPSSQHHTPKPLANPTRNDPSLAKIPAPKTQQRKVKLLSSQVSIMQDEFTTSVKTFDSCTIKQTPSTSDKEYEVFHMIQRKKEEFLKNQHLDIFRYILWGTLATFTCITIGLLVYSTTLNYSMIADSIEVKGQVKNSYAITYQTARINRDIQKIMQGLAYTPAMFKNNSAQLALAINDFQQNFIPLMTLSTKYDFSLQLNQFRYYDIVIQKQNSIAEYAQETIIDAFFQYISSSKNYASYTLTDVTTDAIHQMVQQNTFIQQNGKQLFPNITKRMSYEYLALDQYLYDQHYIHQFVIAISYAVNMAVTILLIYSLIKKINTFNQSVVQLYNEIKLWDATEMRHKCLKFIQKNSTGIMKMHNNNKRRISSLLNVFPQQAFIKVLQSVKNTNIQQPRNLNSSNEDQQLLKLQTSQLQDSKQPFCEKQRKFYVLLTEKNKLTRKLMVFIVLSVVFVAGYFMERMYTNQYEGKVLYYNKRVSELGRVRNNLAFINYYTYELMLKPNDEDYRRLLKSQIDQFYVNTDACYDLIGDPVTILKDTYEIVEETSALIFSSNLNISNNLRYNISNSRYLLQESIFERNIIKITDLINVDMTQKAQTLFSSIKTMKIGFIIGFIFMNMLIVIAIKCWLLEEVLRNSRKSKSMVSMLPPWLIQRNKGIEQILQ